MSVTLLTLIILYMINFYDILCLVFCKRQKSELSVTFVIIINWFIESYISCPRSADRVFYTNSKHYPTRLIDASNL
jgi:hypothetical protein